MAERLLNSRFNPRFYGRRKGRPLRVHRTRLMRELLPHFLVKEASCIDVSKETWLEIGFGSGEHIAEMAEQHPDIQLIGCEVFENGIASLLQHIEEKNLQNILIYPEDGREFLKNLPSACLNKVFIMFPDPWPKKKHQKRRLVNRDFLDDVLRILKPEDAKLRFASDHEDYVRETLALVKDTGFFSDIILYDQKPADWPLTSYNQKAIQAGMNSWYLKAQNRKSHRRACSGFTCLDNLDTLAG